MNFGSPFCKGPGQWWPHLWAKYGELQKVWDPGMACRVLIFLNALGALLSLGVSGMPTAWVMSWILPQGALVKSGEISSFPLYGSL